MKKSTATHMCVLATAAALLAGGAGCKSSTTKPAPADESANRTQDNRLLVRMAVAENVYNGIAAERAVYPKDFRAGTATLNELGNRRVATLIDACRGASGRVVILQGEESEHLYDERVASVRQQFAAAGLDLERVNVTRGEHVPNRGVWSNQALLPYAKMMSEFLAKPSNGGAPVGTLPMAPEIGTSTQTKTGY